MPKNKTPGRKPIYERIAFVASPAKEARQALARLAKRYGNVAPDKADVVVALGGDGLMLRALRTVMTTGQPIYGMHRGTVGFLMNEYRDTDLKARLAAAHTTVIHPLVMRARNGRGGIKQHYAINEVSLFRQTFWVGAPSTPGGRQGAARRADGRRRAGGDAGRLNRLQSSAQGPIIPINAPLLALTSISPFRPRRWRGALLPDSASVTIRVIDRRQAPVAAVADHEEVRDVREVDIRMDHMISMRMLFDPGHSLDERILREQFGY